MRTYIKDYSIGGQRVRIETLGYNTQILDPALNITASENIKDIVSITQEEYDALLVKNPETLYYIDQQPNIIVKNNAYLWFIS